MAANTRKEYWKNYRAELNTFSSINTTIKRDTREFDRKWDQIISNIPNSEQLLNELAKAYDASEPFKNSQISELKDKLQDPQIARGINDSNRILTETNNVLENKGDFKKLLKEANNRITKPKLSEIQSELQKEQKNIAKKE